MTTWLENTIKFIQDDRNYRKENNWPLLTINNVIEFKNNYKIDDSMYVFKPKCKDIKTSITFDSVISDLFKVPGVKDCMVIAGGYIYQKLIINNQFNKNKNIDIDCFFYGKTVNEIDTIFKNITDFFRSSKYNITESRNQYVYNFAIINGLNEYIFQFILKVFDNKSSIIGQFDVSASSVLYDGNEILFTPMSAYSYATLYNYIDTTRASPTYEQRLTKYLVYKQGFGIAFPELDMSKIIELNNDIYGLQIYDSTIKNDKYIKIHNEKLCKISYLHYITRMYDKVKDLDNYSIYGNFVNIPKLIDLFYKNKLNKVYFVVKNNMCIIDTYKIREFYKNKTPFEYNGYIYNLRYYYDDITFKKIIASVPFYDIVGTHEVINKYLNEVISKILLYIDDNYNSNNNKIKWFTEKSEENPLSPCPIQASEWYGKYYKNVDI